MLRRRVRLFDRLLGFTLLLVFVALSVAHTAAQSRSPIPPQPKETEQEIDPDDVISVNTTEVLLPVTVRNAAGMLVGDLTRKDFRVFEEGVEQPLSDLSMRKVPVDVVLMVDASSSVAENLADFRVAAEGFATQLRAGDRVSLIQFDDRVVLLQDWTASLAQLRRALKRITPGMFTRFHDAMLLASRDQPPRGNARHAIIVLTDGIDSGRGSTFDAAMRAALEYQTTVYVISNTQIERSRKQSELDTLLSGADSAMRFNRLRIDDLRLGMAALDGAERHLGDLAAATGGKLYCPATFNDLGDTYREVAEELGKQYTLYYAPLDARRDGRFRRVLVETINASHVVSARIGYYAPKK